jgi:hypothetical protein
VTQAAIRLQKSLTYVTVASKYQDKARRELKGPLNKHQQALLVELQALIVDFVRSIILKYMSPAYTQEEINILADYMMTEKVLACLANYRPPDEFLTYFGWPYTTQWSLGLESKLNPRIRSSRSSRWG